MYKTHPPKDDTDRRFLKRREGGTVLLQIEVTYKEGMDGDE
jgi:hypothetical protein